MPRLQKSPSPGSLYWQWRPPPDSEAAPSRPRFSEGQSWNQIPAKVSTLAYVTGDSWLTSHICLMRKQCHLVAIYQRFLDEARFNSIQHKGMKNISLPSLLSLAAQNNISGPIFSIRFSKAQAIPSGEPSNNPFSTLFSCQTFNPASGIIHFKDHTHHAVVLLMLLDSSFQQNKTLIHDFRPSAHWCV